MAYNSYGQAHRQQAPPQDQPRMRYHPGQGPTDPAGRQYQRNGTHYPSDGSQHEYNAPRGNGVQNGYMPDSYGNLNQGYNDYNGQVNTEPQWLSPGQGRGRGQGQGQGQGRGHPYDERYQNDTHGQFRHNMRQQGGNEAQIGDTRRRAQSKRKRLVCPPQ
jgi:hypothetical protein